MLATVLIHRVKMVFNVKFAEREVFYVESTALQKPHPSRFFGKKLATVTQAIDDQLG